MNANEAMNYIAVELQKRAIDPAIIAALLVVLLPMILKLFPTLPCPPSPTPTPAQIQVACKHPSFKMARGVCSYLCENQGLSSWEAAQAAKALFDVGAAAPEEVLAAVLKQAA